jgi:hypothetical protein
MSYLFFPLPIFILFTNPPECLLFDFRRMFPTVKIRVHNMDPNVNYIVFLDILPVDDKRYRYVYHRYDRMIKFKIFELSNAKNIRVADYFPISFTSHLSPPLALKVFFPNRCCDVFRSDSGAFLLA